jgi:hypothetical protein
VTQTASRPWIPAPCAVDLGDNGEIDVAQTLVHVTNAFAPLWPL